MARKVISQNKKKNKTNLIPRYFPKLLTLRHKHIMNDCYKEKWIKFLKKVLKIKSESKFQI